MTRVVTLRNGLIAAILLVVGLLLWSYFATRRKVVHALGVDDDPYLSGYYDAMNAGQPGTYTGGVPAEVHS